MARQEENEDGFIAEEQEVWDSGRQDSRNYTKAWDMRDARRKREAEEAAQEAWSESEAGQLLKRLTEAYAAYHGCLQRKPHYKELARQFDENSHSIYQRMRANLERAEMAPRCAKKKGNGQRCRAPKVRGRKYCHMHLAMAAARPKNFELPDLDDANGIQVGLQRLIQGVADGTIEQKKATTLAYLFQLALTNVGRVDFEEDWEEEEGEEIG